MRRERGWEAGVRETAERNGSKQQSIDIERPEHPHTAAAERRAERYRSKRASAEGQEAERSRRAAARSATSLRMGSRSSSTGAHSSSKPSADSSTYSSTTVSNNPPLHTLHVVSVVMEEEGGDDMTMGVKLLSGEATIAGVGASWTRRIIALTIVAAARARGLWGAEQRQRRRRVRRAGARAKNRKADDESTSS